MFLRDRGCILGISHKAPAVVPCWIAGKEGTHTIVPPPSLMLVNIIDMIVCMPRYTPPLTEEQLTYLVKKREVARMAAEEEAGKKK